MSDRLSDERLAQWLAYYPEHEQWQLQPYPYSHALALAREVQESRKTLAAIDALHHPHTAYGESFCCHCAATDWPCPTARLLHSEEADRG
jgi:hypothetical protein